MGSQSKPGTPWPAGDERDRWFSSFFLHDSFFFSGSRPLDCLMMCANDLQIPIHAAADDNVRTHFRIKAPSGREVQDMRSLCCYGECEGGKQWSLIPTFRQLRGETTESESRKKGVFCAKPQASCRVFKSVFECLWPASTKQDKPVVNYVPW